MRQYYMIATVGLLSLMIAGIIWVTVNDLLERKRKKEKKTKTKKNKERK